MSIVSIQEQMDGRGCVVDASWARTYTRVFEVVTSSPYIGPKTVRLAGGIPAMGSVYTNGLGSGDPLYEEDLGAFVVGQSVETWPDGAGIAWKVTVNYGPGNTAEFNSDPSMWKLRVQFGGERTERVVDFDRYGNPLMNSAGDRFGDPVTVPDHISLLTITRNEWVDEFDLDLASKFSDTINKFTWNGFGPGYCLMGIITTSEEKYDTSTQRWYYTVTYPVSKGKKPWRKDLLDQGYNVLDSYDRAKPILGPNGQPVSDPRPLDGAGHELEGTEGYDSPVVLPFEVYDEEDWTDLNIDLSLRLGVAP